MSKAEGVSEKYFRFTDRATFGLVGAAIAIAPFFPPAAVAITEFVAGKAAMSEAVKGVMRSRK